LANYTSARRFFYGEAESCGEAVKYGNAAKLIINYANQNITL